MPPVQTNTITAGGRSFSTGTTSQKLAFNKGFAYGWHGHAWVQQHHFDNQQRQPDLLSILYFRPESSGRQPCCKVSDSPIAGRNLEIAKNNIRMTDYQFEQAAGQRYLEYGDLHIGTSGQAALWQWTSPSESLEAQKLLTTTRSSWKSGPWPRWMCSRPTAGAASETNLITAQTAVEQQEVASEKPSEP
jgi:hypothetical protein